VSDEYLTYYDNEAYPTIQNFGSTVYLRPTEFNVYGGGSNFLTYKQDGSGGWTEELVNFTTILSQIFLIFKENNWRKKK
jgi:hypothetical protein